MQILIDLLSQEGIQMPESELREAIASMGYDADSLNKPQAQQLLKLIVKAKGSGAITPTENGKAATKRGSRRSDRQDAPDTSGLANMARQIDSEMAAFESGLNEYTDQQISVRKQRIVETLKNAPVRLVQEVAIDCAEFGGDAEFFRNAARTFCDGFSPIGGGSEDVAGLL